MQLERPPGPEIAFARFARYAPTSTTATPIVYLPVYAYEPITSPFAPPTRPLAHDAQLS